MRRYRENGNIVMKKPVQDFRLWQECVARRRYKDFQDFYKR